MMDDDGWWNNAGHNGITSMLNYAFDRLGTETINDWTK